MMLQPEIASAPIETEFGPFTMSVFSWSENEQDNVLVLRSAENFDVPEVRIQSACYTGEIFQSLDCDCHWQLATSLGRIQEHGGFFIYMLKDGRGAGLLAKVRGLALSANKGIDTAEAYREQGIPLDPRKYDHAGYILKHFSVSSLRLLTNNPRKVSGIESLGFEVVREPLESEPTPHNRDYLQAKAQKLGHLLSAFGKPEQPKD